MSDANSSERPLPLRQVEDGTWEVEDSPGNWMKCETRSDARTISSAPVLLEKSYDVMLPDQKIAAELEATADILERYNIGWGSRFFRHRAEIMRR